VVEPLRAWRERLVRVVCIQLLTMGREQGLCRDIEHGIRNLERGNQTKPFCGVEFAWRGTGLVGLERDGFTGKETNEAG
jgi:hypothetical protein